MPTLDWDKTNYIVESFLSEITKIKSLNPNPQGQLLNDNQGIEYIIASPPEVII